MKRLIMVVVLAAAAGVTASEARAQQGYVVAAPAGSVAPSVGEYPAGYVPPYSYWAAKAPYPARGYVGLGASEGFAYYGRPYGHVYDAWSWSNLDAPPYYGGTLNRYYYPPLDGRAVLVRMDRPS